MWIGPVQDEHSLAYWNLKDLCYPAQIFLAPRPTAPKWCRPIDPDNPLDSARIGAGQEAKGRRVVVVEIRDRAEPLAKRQRRIHAHAEYRPRHIESAAGQRSTGAVHECVRNRKLQLNAEVGGRPNRENRPAAIQEFLELRNRPGCAQAADTIAIFRGNVFWVNARTPASAGTPTRYAVLTNEHVEFADEISGIERRRVYDLVRKLELFENESRPPRGYRSSVLIP